MSIRGIEVAVRDDEALLISLVTSAGFGATDGHGATTWMDAAHRSATTPFPCGYRMCDRTEAGIIRPHHSLPRSGADVAVHRAQTSLFRQDLDHRRSAGVIRDQLELLADARVRRHHVLDGWEVPDLALLARLQHNGRPRSSST